MARIAFRSALILVCAASAAVAAPAGALVLTGTLDAADPTMPVVSIAPPVCVSQGATLVHYELRPIYVSESGTYDFSLTHVGPPLSLVSLYLHSEGFDPASGLPTCLAADNSVPVGFSFELVAGVQYFAVPFDDTFAQTGGDYTLEITGPGDVFEGTATVLAIPTLSSWGLGALAALLALAGATLARRARVG
jgi:hypothetical protein